MMMTTIEKILARAEDYEKKAAALRVAAEVLQGEVHVAKRNGLPAAVKSAIKLRKQQRPAHTPEASPVPTSEPLSDWRAMKQRRAHKADRIVELLRDHGKPMRVGDLATLAKDTGIDNLTGIFGLVKKGLLVSRGKGVRRTYSAA